MLPRMSNLPPDMRYLTRRGGRPRSRAGTLLGGALLLGIAGVVAWPHVSGWFRNDAVTVEVVHCQAGPSATMPPPLEDFSVTAVFRNRTARAQTFVVKDRKGQVLSDVDVKQGDPSWLTIEPHGTETEGYVLPGVYDNTCEDMAVRPVLVKGK